MHSVRHVLLACPQNAKQIRNDVERAKELLATGKEVYVSVAPAFAANYAGVHITAFAEAMKKLGFAGAEETALGATIVKTEY